MEEREVMIYPNVPVEGVGLDNDEKIIATAFREYVDKLVFPNMGAQRPSWDERLTYDQTADLGEMIEKASLKLSDEKGLGMIPPADADDLGILNQYVQHDLEDKLGQQALNLMLSGKLCPMSLLHLRGWVDSQYNKEAGVVARLRLDLKVALSAEEAAKERRKKLQAQIELKKSNNEKGADAIEKRWKPMRKAKQEIRDDYTQHIESEKYKKPKDRINRRKYIRANIKTWKDDYPDVKFPDEDTIWKEWLKNI